MSDVIYRPCTYEEILPLKGRGAKFCGFQYGDKAVYIGAFLEGGIIGCCGYIVKGKKIEFVNDVVSENFRGMGVYRELWNKRQCAMIGMSHSEEYAYCTNMSIMKYLKEGFAISRAYKKTYKVKRIV